MSRPLDTAYDHIKSKILDGTYRPSQKITEVQLSEEIGVSRNTIIKALLMLEQENLVAIEKNKGATIKSFSLQEIINYLEIREVLEGLSIRSAIKNISDQDVLRLSAILSEMEQFVQSGRLDEYSTNNRNFHDVIYAASHNQQAVELIKMIKTQLSRFHFKTILVPGRNKESFEEHKKIYDAVQAHNEAEAEVAIRAHIANLRRTIEQNYNYLS